MDILGGMSSSSGESQQVYLAFKTMQQKFFANGETPLDFQYLQLDPATFKSGWGSSLFRRPQRIPHHQCLPERRNTQPAPRF